MGSEGHSLGCGIYLSYGHHGKSWKELKGMIKLGLGMAKTTMESRREKTKNQFRELVRINATVKTKGNGSWN